MSKPIDQVKSAAAPKLSPTLTIALCAMFSVLVFLFTMLHVNFLVAIPGGIVHLGNVPAFICAILFGKKIGAISTAVGMTAFNIYLPHLTMWAPFTLVIGLAMGFTVGLITERRQTIPFMLAAFVAAGVIRIGGYYIAEVMLFGNWQAPLAAVPFNALQIVVATALVLLVIKPLRLAADRIILRDSKKGASHV